MLPQGRYFIQGHHQVVAIMHFHHGAGEATAKVDKKIITLYGLYFKPTRAPSEYKDRLIYIWRFPC